MTANAQPGESGLSHSANTWSTFSWSLSSSWPLYPAPLPVFCGETYPKDVKIVSADRIITRFVIMHIPSEEPFIQDFPYERPSDTARPLPSYDSIISWKQGFPNSFLEKRSLEMPARVAVRDALELRPPRTSERSCGGGRVFAQLTVAGRGDGGVAETAGFAQLTVADREERRIGEDVAGSKRPLS